VPLLHLVDDSSIPRAAPTPSADRGGLPSRIFDAGRSLGPTDGCQDRRMCNLYTWKMTAKEMRALKLHFQFIGMT
jgi:hypothetical protein